VKTNYNQTADQGGTNKRCIENEERSTIAWDTHSKLNAVSHRRLIEARSVNDIRHALKTARDENVALIQCGGRHSMGGQQFAHDGVLLDMRQFSKVLNFDNQRGLVRVEAGIMWSQLVDELDAMQQTTQNARPWSICQKPTGADNISVGGSLSSNIHGRGLKFQPFVQDIEEFELIKTDGELLTASRTENEELFKLAIGGYGLFGIVVSITLRLRPRKLMKRVVETTTVDCLIAGFNERIEAGHEFGDFQFAIDPDSEDFLFKGILASYVPTEQSEEISSNPEHKLSIDQWQELLRLAHTDKSKAFRKYEQHYLRTNGQIYRSDTMQLSTYLDDYHVHLDRLTGKPPATEIISELYVPRAKLAAFMGGAANFLRAEHADVIYGTIRLIEQDTETFLPWAKQNYACIIFNIHTEHDMDGIAKSARIFSGLIELAQSLGGSYYLTYHRFANRQLVERAYPQFGRFLEYKLKYDPNEIIQSQWYRHYRTAFKSGGFKSGGIGSSD
jgi:FAD/FMN-containing dehydrogenase